MEDALLPHANRRFNIDRTDSKEMTELASDTQTEETVKIVKTMDEYDVIVTDPGPGRLLGNPRRKMMRKYNIGRRDKARATTWTNRLHQRSNDDDEPPEQSLVGDSLEIMQTSYFSHDDSFPDSANYIQHIYAKERFGDRPTMKSMLKMTRTQVSVEGDLSCNIDGRSSSFSNEEDFIPVESVETRDMSTTEALELCNKYLLKPYNAFLKVIGWRSFQSSRLEHVSWYKRVASAAYPCFVFLMLLLTSVAQALICFSRSKSTRFPDQHDSTADKNDSSTLIICKDNIVSSTVAGDLLILTAYLWGLYMYRFSDPEHLSALIETVFLSYNSRLVRRSQKRLTVSLLFFLVMGISWMIISLLLSVLRLFAFNIFDSRTQIYFFNKLATTGTNMSGQQTDEADPRYIATITIAVFCLVGFLFFDLLYVAVIVNYCSQCQLLHYYVVNVTEKIRHKAYALGDAVKEMYRVYEFLQVLNGKVAIITSLVFFLFVQGTVTAYLDYMTVQPDNSIGIALGFGNIFQWLSIMLVPLILAAGLTGACKELKKVCLEVGARPFVYSDTPQLVLDSFLLYTLSTNYRAKIGFVAIHPEYLFVIAFTLAMIYTINSNFSRFQFAVWI